MWDGHFPFNRIRWRLGTDRAAAWLLTTDCSRGRKKIQWRQSGENMATASNSPTHLELNPSPSKTARKKNAARSEIWNYFVCGAGQDGRPAAPLKPSCANRYKTRPSRVWSQWSLFGDIAWCFFLNLKTRSRAKVKTPVWWHFSLLHPRLFLLGFYLSLNRLCSDPQFHIHHPPPPPPLTPLFFVFFVFNSTRPLPFIFGKINNHSLARRSWGM